MAYVTLPLSSPPSGIQRDMPSNYGLHDELLPLAGSFRSRLPRVCNNCPHLRCGVRSGVWIQDLLHPKKESYLDAKQSMPKADQAVSSVSTAPALVDRINLLIQRRLRQQVWLWSFLWSCVCWLILLWWHKKYLRASDEQPEYIRWVRSG